MDDLRLNTLIERYLDESLDESELAELEDCIKEHRWARRRFAEMLWLHGRMFGMYHASDVLQMLGATESEPTDLEDVTPDALAALLDMEEFADAPPVSYAPPAPPSDRREGLKLDAADDDSASPLVIVIPRWLAASAVIAAVVMLAIGIWVLLPDQRHDQVAPDLATPATPFFATVVDVAVPPDSKAVASYQPGDHVAGSIELGNEFLELRLDNGTHLSLQGPLSGELSEATEMMLAFGQALVDVNQSRDGFSIKTPAGRFRDIGTVFAVDHPQHGNSRLYVLEGEVIMEDTAAGDDQGVSVTSGQAAEVSTLTGQISLQDTFDRSFDKTAAEARWRYRLDQIRDATVAYWRFEPEQVPAEPLQHTATGSQNRPAVLDTTGNRNHLYIFDQHVMTTITRSNLPAATIPHINTPNQQAVYIPPFIEDVRSFQDLFTRSPFSNPLPGKDVERIEAAQLTIELSFCADSVEGAQSILTHDGDVVIGDRRWSWVDLQIVDGQLEAAVIDTRGHRVTVSSPEPVVAGKWVSIALVISQDHYDLYTADPAAGEYQHQGRGELEGGLIRLDQFDPSEPSMFWSLGRGRLNNDYAYPYGGYIDEVRITALALDEDEFLFSRRE